MALWRVADRTLLCGDACANARLWGCGGFTRPPWLFNHDQAQMRESIAKLAALRPKRLGFGHGAPFRNRSGEFEQWACKQG